MSVSSQPEPGPRPRPRPSWIELQKRRRRNRLLHLFDASFAMRLLVAAAASGVLLATVNRWENCRTHGFKKGCLMVDTGGIVTVGNVESLSIVGAAFLYVLEGTRRHRRENQEAMELILSCQQLGTRISHARNEALERLSADGLWLDGLDLSHAQLEDLRAPHARWRDVVLQHANLHSACLHDADLSGSDLRDADLRGADLQHADLRRVKLHGAKLQGADLRCSDLRDAQAQPADLEGCLLQGALLPAELIDLAQSP